jgi:anti-sigma factor ChrR (cupin superfamily)
MGCHDVRPLLPARVEELTPLEARVRAQHVATCPRCAAEAAAYTRLVRALTAMAALEAEPVAGTLERALAVIDRRRALTMTDPRVAMFAAGSAGALVATLVVARALRQRRRTPPSAPRSASPLPGLAALTAPVLARAK